MPLFYLINDWAGRIEWLDAAMRLIVVGAVPLLWTLLVWTLLLTREEDLPTHRNSLGRTSRVNLIIATVFTALGCAFGWWAIVEMAREGWGTDIFSPRPFVTHRVNLLLVDANDNSYPCIEVVLAAAGATLGWALRGKLGRVAWITTLLFGFARVFCGLNYPIDILVGWMLGWAIAALSLALRRAPLALTARDGKRLLWSLRHQAVLSCGVIAMVLGSALLEVLRAPRAAIRAAQTVTLSQKSSPRTASFAGPVGEGVASGPSSNGQNATAPLQVNSDYGRQPRIEKMLARAIDNLALPHRTIEIEVAQITVGTSSYRAAAVRFLVQPKRLDERRLVAQSAARIVRCVFAADAGIQNVDALGIIFLAPDADNTHLDGEGGAMTAAHNEPRMLPVFTSSVQRRNLRIINGPQWANASGVDEGLWLRARSRLYIDPQVLADNAAVAASTAKPIARNTPIAPKPKIIAPVAPALRPKTKPTAPISTPTPTAKPTSTTTPKLRPAPRRTVKRRVVRKRVRRTFRRRSTLRRRRLRR